MDDSIVFASLRQSAPHLVRSLGQPESTSQTASRSIQPFLHSWRQRVPILYNGPSPFPPNYLLAWGIWTRSNAWFLGHTPVHVQNDISIGLVRFCRVHYRDRQTDRQTDHATPSVTIDRIYGVYCDADWKLGEIKIFIRAVSRMG